MIYAFFILYFISLILIGYQDLKFYLIRVYNFYLFAITSLISLYIVGDYYIGLYIVGISFLLIIFLDILEELYGEIKLIGKKWRLFDTGIYDIYLYIYFIVFVLSYLISNFGKLLPFIILGISFLITTLFGTIFFIKNSKRIPLFAFGSCFFLVFFLLYFVLQGL